MMNFDGRSRLSDDELQALRDGRLWIDCLAMRLEGGAGDTREVYSGPGYIRQEPDRGLTFTLYTDELRSVRRIYGELETAVLGASLGDEEFFVLTATDKQGRSWVGEDIFPSFFSNQSREGVAGSICSGQLRELRLTAQLTGAQEGSDLFLQILGEFKIPVNTYTETIEFTGPRRRRALRANALHFDSAGYDVLLVQEPGLLQVEMSSEDALLPESFELRVVEALEFLLARDGTRRG